MRLLRNTEVPDGRSLTTFRTSSLRAGFWALLLLGITCFLGAGFLYAPDDLPRVAWVFLIPIGGLFLTVLAIVSLAALSDFRATFRSSNWVLRVGKGGLWLQLRSFRNTHFEEADETAAFLGFLELAGARRASERIRSGSDDTETTVHWLELVPAEVGLEPLRAAVQAERERKGPTRRLLGISSSGRSRHAPVVVTQDGNVRVDWHGRRMLRVLRKNGVKLLDDVGPMESGERDSDGAILELAEEGQALAAIKLARVTHGMGLAEAKAFVDGLNSDAA